MHSDTQIETLFHSLNCARKVAINDMIAEGEHYLDAAIRYDSELAPLGTNEEMLIAIGVNPDTDSLGEIINGLAKWNIFLTETNHLIDEELRDFLVNKVFKDQIRIIPPNEDIMAEFINLGLVPGTNDSADRDAYLPRPAIPV